MWNCGTASTPDSECADDVVRNSCRRPQTVGFTANEERRGGWKAGRFLTQVLQQKGKMQIFIHGRKLPGRDHIVLGRYCRRISSVVDHRQASDCTSCAFQPLVGILCSFFVVDGNIFRCAMGKRQS